MRLSLLKILFLLLLPELLFSQGTVTRARKSYVDTMLSQTAGSYWFLMDSGRIASFVRFDSTSYFNSTVAPGWARIIVRGDSGIYYQDFNSRVRLDSNFGGVFNKKQTWKEVDGSPIVTNVDSVEVDSAQGIIVTNPSNQRMRLSLAQNLSSTGSPVFQGLTISTDGITINGGFLTLTLADGIIYNESYSITHAGAAGAQDFINDAAKGNLLYSQGTTTTPIYSANPFLYSSTSNLGFGLTDTSINKNITTIAQSSDSSAIVSSFTNLGKPQFKIVSQTGATNFIVDSSGKVGIGTNSPSAHIEVVSDSGSGQADIHTTTYSTNGGGIFHGRFARGTRASPSAVLGGDIVAGIGGRAYDGTSFNTSSPASIHWVADGNQTTGNHGQHINFLTTPTGSTTRSGRMRIDESGYLNLGDTTKPYDFLSLYNTSSLNVFNMTATDKNTNKSTSATAKDTSSIRFSFSSNTAKPIFDMVDGSGRTAFHIDTNGGVWSQPYSTDATALVITSRGFFSFRDVNSPVSSSAEMGVFGYNGGGGGGLGAGFRLYSSGGTVSTPTATVAGHGGFISFIGHDGTNYVTGSKAIITLQSSGTWTSTSTPALITFGTTPTGSTTRSERMRIDTNGNVGIGTLSPTTLLHLVGGAVRVDRAALTTQNVSILEGDASGNYLRSLHAENGKKPFFIENMDGSQGTPAGNGGFQFRTGHSSSPTTVFTIDTSGGITGTADLRGSDAFTTTATTDTVTVTRGASTDLYFIQLTGAAAPSANDMHKVEALTGKFVVHRSASGTSGLTYNWFRIK